MYLYTGWRLDEVNYCYMWLWWYSIKEKSGVKMIGVCCSKGSKIIFWVYTAQQLPRSFDRETDITVTSK